MKQLHVCTCIFNCMAYGKPDARQPFPIPHALFDFVWKVQRTMRHCIPQPISLCYKSKMFPIIPTSKNSGRICSRAKHPLLRYPDACKEKPLLEKQSADSYFSRVFQQLALCAHCYSLPTLLMPIGVAREDFDRIFVEAKLCCGPGLE